MMRSRSVRLKLGMDVAVREKSTLGHLLRGLRHRYKLTLKQMSERTGIPFSTLAKVEQDRLTLSYDKLRQISDRLNIRMSELFSEEDVESRPSANSRRSIATIESAISVVTPGYEYFYLAPELSQKDMIPIYTIVKARNMEDFGELLRHSGQEFIYVVKGAIDVHTEFYGKTTLTQGQAVYLDSSMGHAYTIASEAEEAHIVSVCSATQEQLLDNLPLAVPLPE